MERNITIGLIIAFLLVVAGAFLLNKSDNGGGFLLDFLKNVDNSTTNSTTNETTVINETINETINNTINETTFTAEAVYDNNTNKVLISINAAKENITVDKIAVFTSYDNNNFTTAATLENVTLPTVVEVTPANNTSILYYYAEILFNNATYRLPSAGAYNITLNATNETAS